MVGLAGGLGKVLFAIMAASMGYTTGREIWSLLTEGAQTKKGKEEKAQRSLLATLSEIEGMKERYTPRVTEQDLLMGSGTPHAQVNFGAGGDGVAGQPGGLDLQSLLASALSEQSGEEITPERLAAVFAPEIPSDPRMMKYGRRPVGV